MKVIAALVIIAQNKKQPKCPSTGEGIGTVLQSYGEVLLSNKKEWTMDMFNSVNGS